VSPLISVRLFFHASPDFSLPVENSFFPFLALPMLSSFPPHAEGLLVGLFLFFRPEQIPSTDLDDRIYPPDTSDDLSRAFSPRPPPVLSPSVREKRLIEPLLFVAPPQGSSFSPSFITLFSSYQPLASPVDDLAIPFDEANSFLGLPRFVSFPYEARSCLFPYRTIPGLDTIPVYPPGLYPLSRT